jgi:arsenate reductase (glutaredoxin)
MYKVYGIPNCDTVKKSLTWLKENGIVFEFHDYKKAGITKEKLDEWLKQYPWEELVNRKGMTWKQLEESEKPTNQAAAIQLMLDKTSVIRRPIIEKGKIRAIGFDPESFQKL